MLETDLNKQQQGQTIIAQQFKQDEYEQLWDEKGFIMWVRQARRDQFFVRVSGHLDMTPMQTFKVFTNPDNSKVFRDVESIVYRKVLQSDQDMKVVEVKQRARWRILIFQGIMVSHLVVKEEPRKGKIHFRLGQPGLMKKWEGEWKLISDGKNGTNVSLQLEVSPSFVPPFLTGLLRALTSGSTKRFIQDVQKVDKLFQQGGRTLDEILGNQDGVEEWCDPSQSSSCPELKSFEIDFQDELIDGEFIEIQEPEKKLKWWQKLKQKITNKEKNNDDKSDEKVIQQRQFAQQERERMKSEKKRAKLEKKLSKKESKRVLKERKQSLKGGEKKSLAKKRSKEEKQREKLQKKIARAESKRLEKENRQKQQEQTC